MCYLVKCQVSLKSPKAATEVAAGITGLSGHVR